MFPRSKERGSVEARHSCGAGVRLDPWFPRSKERGSVEAEYGLTEEDRQLLFPRSKERGSVEAFDFSIRGSYAIEVSAFERTRLR